MGRLHIIDFLLLQVTLILHALPDIGTEAQATTTVGTNKGLMSYVHQWTARI